MSACLIVGLLVKQAIHTQEHIFKVTNFSIQKIDLRF